ncbi:MAG TPA: MFS transporter [Pirellulaceae bacterium]|nr:MFS transporter [Pirellulaceae bacterium]
MNDAASQPMPGDATLAPPSRGSLLVIFLTVFIDLLGFGMVLPLLPLYARRFGVDEHGWELGLLMASFSAMTFLFAPLWGRLSDRIGRRPVIVVGLAASAVFYGVFGLAATVGGQAGLAWLFFARIGAGIAAGTIPTAQAYIADVTPVGKRTKGMALIGIAFGLGFTFGPLIGYAALVFSKSESEIATSPWPGYAAAMLSGLACLLALALLPESLRPGKRTEHHSFFDWRGWSDALHTPSIPAILITAFVSVVSFGAYETTLALLLNSSRFGFRFEQILLYFAFIGLTLSVTQGALVRPLASRVSEVMMATAGVFVTILGFLLLSLATQQSRLPLLIIASAVEVTGFSLITPSVQSLVSRRSDPAKQGGILGVSQGTSALARVVGPLIAVPLFFRSPEWPYYAAIAMMAVALAVFLLFARHGKDYGTTDAASELPSL